jgi:TM2 domain-containing membrane protein YozV
VATASAVSSAVSSAASSALSAIREAYTTNAICGKQNCINPIFPGLEDLHLLQQSKWISSSLRKTSESMGFCRNAITYDPALPAPFGGGGSSIKSLVQRQDNAASTMFYYHVTGLGLEAWEYQKPEYSNDCIKSIWRMVCFTYFPRAEIGTQDGGYSSYIRPCQSSCQNYVRACGVECCDESVQCVFSHTKAISATQKVTTEGYTPHDGPSSLCTGGARRSAVPLGAGFWAILGLSSLFSFDGAAIASGMRSLFAGRKLLLAGLIVTCAISLQGCDYDVPVHNVGNWRAEPDYLIQHEFVPPGGSAKQSSLNSCSLQRLAQTLQCSGRGVCKLWDTKNLENTLSFCECDTDWADPECRTKRKSQFVAYFLSMFLGFLGADQFYLGFPAWGLMKFFTFGGFGVLWVMDIIRIGSAPVYASNYQVAADLPHYAFVLTVVMCACFVGFFFAYYVTVGFRARKRREAMMLQSDEDARQKDAIKPFTDSYGGAKLKPVIHGMDAGGPPMFDAFKPSPGPGGYGSMGTNPMSMGQMPPNMGSGTMAPGMGMDMGMGMGSGQMGMGPPTMAQGMGPIPSTSFGMGPQGMSMNMGRP